MIVPTPLLVASVAGALVGIAAFVGDGLPGVLGAVFLGLFSSASSWMLVASLVGFFATSRWRAALGAACFGLAVTVAYYLLRWLVLEPWSIGFADATDAAWNSAVGLRFLLEAAVWIIGTTIGAGVLGVLVHPIRRQAPLTRAGWAGVWLAVCVAPSLAYLPELVTGSIGAWSATDWMARADSGPVYALTTTIVGGLLAIAVVTAVGPAQRRGASLARFAGVGLATTVVLAVLFRLASDLFRSITLPLF